METMIREEMYNAQMSYFVITDRLGPLILWSIHRLIERKETRITTLAITNKLLSPSAVDKMIGGQTDKETKQTDR